MFAERITLAWKPPRDDGGSKVTNYVVEKREENRKSWVHVSNDPKEGLYTVQRLTEGHEYEFRVMAQNKYGVGPPLYSEHEKARNLFSKLNVLLYYKSMSPWIYSISSNQLLNGSSQQLSLAKLRSP